MRTWRTWFTALATTGLIAAALLAGALPATTAVAAPAAAAGAGRAQVPWRQVGPGWVLVQYSQAKPEGGGAGPVTLDLTSPRGTIYKLASWPSSSTAPALVAWSPDGTRALFDIATSNGGKVEQLTLATGRTSTFRLAGGASALGYTSPDGVDIVGSTPAGNGERYARYSQSGALLRVLGTSSGGRLLYSADGTELTIDGSHGLALVSNGGTVIRQLPVPAMDSTSCDPIRWWNTGTILASCAPPSAAAPRLWLVPASGARPTAITPQRSGSSPDLGDLDAWQLSSGLYLQGAGPCAVLQIFRQAANGSIQLVKVPGTDGDNAVLTALGSRLLVQAPLSCEGSNSLLWFNPGTDAEQWLIRTPSAIMGVTAAIPFFSRENGWL
jgi:hypothetical protein